MTYPKFTRPVCFFDIEATGLDIIEDRIVEISILRVTWKNQQEKEELIKTWQINPEIEISKEAISIHGIKKKDLQDKPTFKEIAKDIYNLIKDCNLAGYNSSRFDIPILAEEFYRAGIYLDLKKHRCIDIQTIFHKKEPRDLKAAYSYYCNKELKNAHSSKADALASYEILEEQIKKYPEIMQNGIKSLEEFSSHGKKVDPAGLIVLNENEEEVFAFGKYKGESVSDIFKKRPEYYSWIQHGKFPLCTKELFTKIRLKTFNKA